MDTSGYTGMIFNLLSSVLFWVILAVIFVGIAFATLIIRRKRKLVLPYIEITDLGRSKGGFKFGKKQKAGYFKEKTFFLNLIDYGNEEICKTRDGRIILNVSSEDYHEINGEMGLIVQRSPEDPRILVPLTKVELQNGKLLNTIAPAEYRGVALDIIKKAEKETADSKDKILQYVFWGGIIIFSFIAILLITQMVQKGQANASQLILEAGRMNAENLKTICQGIAHVGDVVSSTAP